MSEPIPESIPTSADPRSKRPTKRRAVSPNGQQAKQVEALFAKPDRDIRIPDGSVSKRSELPPPPEIVANVQGSSAGAGSGEFHVYKASRRREYERLRTMEEEVNKEQEDVDFQRAREERAKQDAAKTEKNRKKRERKKRNPTLKDVRIRNDPNGPLSSTIAKAGKPPPLGFKNLASTKPDTAPAHNAELSTTNGGTSADMPTQQSDTEAAQPVGIIIHDED